MDPASSSSPPKMEYDVYLSFRGEDTRDNFTSHLYAALDQKKITTYKDDNFQSREETKHGLLEAIKNSKLSIIIFSEHYADSSWCLDELVHILDCQKTSGQIVMPIFYHVDPSCRTYEAAFARHESRYKKRLDKVRQWRDAFASATALSGWDSATIRHESKLIEAVVQDVMKKLMRLPIDDFEDLVGIWNKIKKIDSLLDISSAAVRIVGIWGMGGIGKTTLAQLVFKRLYSQFEVCCFLENVREECEKIGISHLQNRLVSTLLGEEHQRADTMLLGLTNLDKERLRSKKVLVVLDDVDYFKQVELLVGGPDWYGAGSRIIVTSRDAYVLKTCSNAIYEVPGLDFDEACQLFNFHAFKTEHAPEDYIELSESFIKNAMGSPMALKVSGSYLRCKRKEEWKCALEKSKVIPQFEIQHVLQRSFDALDESEKRIFLDVACFFKGDDIDFVKRILEGCRFFPEIGMQVLIEKSLLTMGSNKLLMHDLIEDMGREIVRQQSPREPGKRSRLWKAGDIYHVFKNNTGTEAVESIFLDMRDIKMVNLRPTAFSKMYNLRMLKLHNYFGKCLVRFPQGLQLLPDALRYLYWDEYPFKSLPLSFTGKNLVELKMQHSKLEQLWEGVQPVQDLQNLKVIDLSFATKLTEIPNLSRAPNIKSVSLRFCRLLREVPSYFQHLDKLTSLNLEDCSSLEKVSALPRNIENLNLTRCVSLKSLPRYIFKFASLRHLEISGCSNFDYMNFPEILEFLEHLE